ncbi:glucose-6-phosphate dehydrogenase [Pusillimonas sp. ANT_WB101]|uniref:glucose-6-phosphate dehydrogenase n=1 Tax=Pusillimonas sp. ANT_WB101 TaxID=2597356 RepID=UPI0011EF95BF|nr:glucose-6-phosphate dehydrogenase [Pusillimonas sp. ANT_WB101]KAA0910553.1 glucose-6-phosphate dehydrogenase [Pusillimonas sp. ANT_WB101]
MATTPAFDIIFFGGTGDLALRKLIPALFYAHQSGTLNKDGRIYALGRKAVNNEAYLALLEERVKPRLGDGVDESTWQGFTDRIHFLKLDADRAEDYTHLAGILGCDSNRVTVHYLATAPHLFTGICGHLAKAGLNHPGTRLVLEKPLGHDLASSTAINQAVGQWFTESQIYRIDHYLGKESVQNLLAIRFGNTLFEPLWRREWIDNVQITIAEELGVEERGEFYDRTGALRDMLQSHLLQLLCMVAMEPPASMSEDAVRDEKLKVLKSLKPFSTEDVLTKTVRGQYRNGAIRGQAVTGYLDEPHVASDSNTETFVALQAEISNWRWAGVPFFLRTGKRMQERVAEIVINFRHVPHALFPAPVDQQAGNKLVIRLQPTESVRLHFMTKKPGDTMSLQSTYLNLDFQTMFKTPRADAYERLLLDVIRGRLALFMRGDEQAQAWSWVEPILACWDRHSIAPKTYTAGSWGPAASSGLLSRAGATWQEET